MAQKKFKQFFAKDFIGIDGESSAIEEDPSSVNRAVNYEMAVSNSLRGRVGCQVAGESGRFSGLFSYAYTRTQPEYSISYTAASTTGVLTAADGATITKLIGANYQMWVRDTMAITVTRVSGSYPFTWYSYVSGSNIRFTIKANGVSILDTSLGDVVAGTQKSIWDLLSEIDALAELAISRTTRGTCPPFALATGSASTSTGNPVPYGTRRTFNVSAGHNFFPGDIITTVQSSGASPGRLAAGFVISTTATTVVFAGAPFDTRSSGDVLGYMSQPACSFEIGPASTAASGNLTLNFPYWRLINTGDITSENNVPGYPFYAEGDWNDRLTTVASGNFYTPPSSVNFDGNLYVASSAIKFNTGSTTGYPNNLLKIDGVTVNRAGLPQAVMSATAIAGGALAGTYKYKSFLRRYDAQGNIIEGRPSDVQTATYGGGNNQGTVTGTPPLYSEATGFQGRSCYKYTNESPAAGASFTVDDNSAAPGLNAFLQVGDPIALMDSTAPTAGLTGVGTLHRTYCTYYEAAATPATGPTSIKVADSSGYTINNNTPISTGLTMVFLRTVAGGNTYYVLAEVPMTGYAAYSFTDNVADTALAANEEFIDAEIGKEHDPPPPCSIVCQHQGGLVVARGPSSPNTVSFSSSDGTEYFPVASNSFDVPSTQSGPVSAIASDTNDRLAVFKARAYYDVVGDLDGGTFSINVRNEGDYGITSQGSLARVRDALIGLSENGFVLIQDGFLNTNTFKGLNTRLIGQNYYNKWAVACNDSLSRRYICSIPVPSAEPQTFVIDYSKDVLRTFELSYATKIDMAGGMAVVDNNFFHLSQTSPFCVFKRLPRFDGNSPSGNGDGDSFIDNVSAISYILESSVINNGEPDVLNTPIRARVWSIPNDYVVDGWVPFAALLEGGCSPLSANCGTGNNSTSSTITFAADTNLWKDVKLVSTKTHFYVLRLTTNTIRTAPFITGYEILYAESYNPEDLIK